VPPSLGFTLAPYLCPFGLALATPWFGLPLFLLPSYSRTWTPSPPWLGPSPFPCCSCPCTWVGQVGTLALWLLCLPAGSSVVLCRFLPGSNHSWFTGWMGSMPGLQPGLSFICMVALYFLVTTLALLGCLPLHPLLGLPWFPLGPLLTHLALVVPWFGPFPHPPPLNMPGWFGLVPCAPHPSPCPLVYLLDYPSG